MIRPSSLERIALCPASHKLSDKVPPRPSSPAAERGTHAHKMLERLLKGDTIHDSEVMEEPFKLASWAFERLKEIRADLEKDGYKLQVLSESPVSVPGCPDGGTIDVLYLSPTMTQAVIVDLKTGQTEVEPDSQQMRGYSVGVVETYGVSEVWTIILQADLEQVKIYRADESTLTEWAVELHTIVNNANAENPEVRPSAKACKYCPAAHICPAHSKVLSEWVSLPKVNAEEWISKSDADQKASIMESIEAAERFLEGVRNAILSEATKGKLPKGWELKSARTDKVWKEDAIHALRGIPAAWETKLKTPAACIKANVNCEGLYDLRPSTPSLKRVK